MATRRNSPAEKVVTIWLVVKADMSCRLARGRSNNAPTLKQDEVALKINLVFPRSWASVIGTMDILVPDNIPTFTWSPDPEDPEAE